MIIIVKRKYKVKEEAEGKLKIYRQNNYRCRRHLRGCYIEQIYKSCQLCLYGKR